MTLVSRLAAVLFVVALPLFMITTSVRFVASEVRFYEWGFREYDAPQVTGVPLPELDRAGREIVNYFQNDAPMLRIIVNEDGEETSLFNSRETLHMSDVKRVMRFIYRLNEWTLAYVLTYVAGSVLWTGERTMRGLAKLSLAAIGTGLAAVAVIGIAALVNFEAAWTRFHLIVFPKGLWQFNPDTDHLIQMFPDPFWQVATAVVAALIVAQAMIVAIAATAYLVLSRPERKDLPGAAAQGPRLPAEARAAE
ncbi:MAG: TIGR01906 family membrane protein [Chloroflexi bacterium]|nr:TIGR01906 family membrane protein [Chloroflexota bacterium]